MGGKSDIEAQLRKAVRAAGPYLRTAKLSGVDVGIVSRFVRRERNINLRNAAKLAAAVGLELRPVRPARRKGS